MSPIDRRIRKIETNIIVFTDSAKPLANSGFPRYFFRKYGSHVQDLYIFLKLLYQLFSFCEIMRIKYFP